ncbi:MULTISPECIES: glycerophosphodiester phosphodiesterase family protein [unclassified Roseateles]|uniref:glycerophosphodiester phosphodiesterase family protein n=1 Tax=unclassified Roseateles TaxID=2626991 RepID=UPI0006F69F7E|nr:MULTISPECIES: glycerophosphodiester phosphodiesterase family protein [unclassified Roseateles]KQW45698.1 glycerophosphodiester phosphodiesterase [Pelomonas sp. Root405]KRA72542.1 glycerophosphodiester phosphodiesterase [Pelomonas sp. Root662]
MRRLLTRLALIALAAAALPAQANRDHDDDRRRNDGGIASVQLGPRPFFLANEMSEGPLKKRLQHCAAHRENFKPTLFSIGHRGAPLQFPEHTQESYEAAARSGAGIVECDVTFTKDKELVCRHAQNDLHTTTNILATPLASKCVKPFTPAVFDAAGTLVAPAAAECRTSELTLAEFKTLRGKMDAFNPRGRTVAEYMAGTANWRTDINAGPTSGTLLTLKESIALFKKLDVKMTPELKSPSVVMPFDGFTQAAYAQKMIDEHKAAGVSPRDLWPQSFDINDVLYWVKNEPAYGRQAVYLDDANVVADLPSAAELKAYRAQGIRIVAPPLFALLTADTSGNILPSQYARNAKAAGLDIITWTLERSGILADGGNGFYFQTFDTAIKREGDVYRVLDVLAQDIGVLGVFSDWPATTSFYANCMGQK